MPSVKDFANNEKDAVDPVDNALDLDSKKSKGPRRRPGRDADEAISRAERIVAEAGGVNIDTASEEDTFVENLNENHHNHEGPDGFEATQKKESPFKRLRLNIKGQEILNLETPDKVVELMDAVVEEWKTDGSFNSIPVANPVALVLAAKGLRKAKEIEKKLEEKGVFAMAQMGLSIIKTKLKK